MDRSQLNKESCEEMKSQTEMFYLDCVTAGVGGDNSSHLQNDVLLYDVDVETLKEAGFSKQDDNSEQKLRSSRCFNCDGDHFINDCKVERNPMRIAENRKKFKNKHPARKKVGGGGRYHRPNLENSKETMKVGILSDELRSSMDLRWNELPVHIYNMRKFGYPPGWEEDAIEKTSTLKIYNSSTSSISIQPEEIIINPDLIHSYSGFNSPVVYPFYDDYRFWRVVPYSDRYSKENYIRQLQSRINSKNASAAVQAINSEASNNLLGRKQDSADHSKYHPETSDLDFIYERRSGLQYNTRDSDPYSHYTGVYATASEQQNHFHENNIERKGRKDRLKRNQGKPVRTTEFSHKDSSANFRRGRGRRGKKRYNPYNNEPAERIPRRRSENIDNYFPDDENLLNNNSEVGDFNNRRQDSTQEETKITTSRNGVQTISSCEKSATILMDEINDCENNDKISNTSSNDVDDDIHVLACVDYTKKPLKSSAPAHLKSTSPELLKSITPELLKSITPELLKSITSEVLKSITPKVVNSTVPGLKSTSTEGSKSSQENGSNLRSLSSPYDLQSCIQVLKRNFEQSDYGCEGQLKYAEVPSLSKFSVGICQYPLEPPREQSGRLQSVINKIRVRNRR